MSDMEDELEYANISESDSEDSISSNSDAESYDDSNNVSAARNWYEISVNEPSPPPSRFPFLPIPTQTFQLSDEYSVLEYFKLFFDDVILGMIVTETNRYAEQHAGTSSNDWCPVTKEDILIMLAITILQGIEKKPDTRMYWSTREIFCSPIFPKLMSQRRYLRIMRYLHFSNNEDYNLQNHPNHKLNKIWPIFDNINMKCSSLYIPERDVTVDESLLLYKGRLGWKQYLPMKRSRFGIKFFLLCESKSGYLYNSIIYTGKGTILSEKYKNMPLTAQIVLSLADPLLDQGYCITMDNYYTSPLLAEYLISRKTDTYGTMRINRKHLPTELQNKKLRKGEIIAFQRGKAMVMKWRDKKDICLLSTIHNPIQVSTNKRDKKSNAILKPKLVVDYNHTMGGVDRFDQQIHDYPIPRKRGKKYYKKIFFHLLDFCVYNAFILYRKNAGKKDHLEFRATLVESLISEYHTGLRTSRSGGRPKLPGPMRLTERHFPEFIPPTQKKDSPTRHCAVCCKKRNENGKRKRKETRYYCKPCDKGLCAVPCFMIYHTKLDF